MQVLVDEIDKEDLKKMGFEIKFEEHMDAVSEYIWYIYGDRSLSPERIQKCSHLCAG